MAMPQPTDAWDLAPDKERIADSVVTFILFSEDAVCEPAYFTSLQKPGKVKVSVTGDQKAGFRNYTNSLVSCEQQGLLENNGAGGYRIRPDITHHIWSIYDRDVDNGNPAARTADDITFSQSIHTCQQAGINVAWSHDAFELWILLHFEDVIPGVFLPRHEIYQRLTNIFKTLPGQSAEMAHETSKAQFSYKVSFKKRNEFNLYVLPLLEARRANAEARARLLNAAFTAGHFFHQRNPATSVPELVNSILSFH